MAGPVTGEGASIWGTFEVPTHAAGRWCLGPLELRIRRGPGDWELAWRSEPDRLLERQSVALPHPFGDPAPSDGWERARYGFSGTGARVVLAPMLADRAVVVRPDAPFHLPPGQKVTVYVSTPVTVGVEAEGARLVEIPAHPLSDTWFGPSTREGEICYAARTRMRLALTPDAVRSHRAITPVVLANRGSTSLLVARMRLPVPNLSLYADTQGGLWTERLDMDAGGDVADVRLGGGPPAETPGAQRVSRPRFLARGNLVMRVFSAVFS